MCRDILTHLGHLYGIFTQQTSTLATSTKAAGDQIRHISGHIASMPINENIQNPIWVPLMFDHWKCVPAKMRSRRINESAIMQTVNATKRA